MKKNHDINIAVLGLWHLGSVYAASLAKSGFNVLGFDFDQKIVSNLKKSIPPIFEPQLSEIIKNHLNKNLNFTNSEKSIQNQDYIFITYDVPVDEKDRLDLKIINKTFIQVTKLASEQTVIVISSQIPIGTSRNLVKLLKKRGFFNPKIIYFPENLRLGQAFESFLNPDRIILGSDNQRALDKFIRDFQFLKCPVITMGLESAEMVKHALNSFLATCISFSSELSDIAEKTGANMLDVIRALKADKRVSPFSPINPGLGFAGGTLGRDVQSLKKIAEKYKYKTKLLSSVYDVNQDRINQLIFKIKSIHPSLKNKNLGILGLTYKPNTNTLRRSFSLELASALKKQVGKIKAFDPAISETIKNYPFIKVSKNIDDFFTDLDLIVLMTSWPQFKEIDLNKPAQLMRQKAVIDTGNFLDKDYYLNKGFTYLGMGGN